jgi:hypothetical protein
MRGDEPLLWYANNDKGSTGSKATAAFSTPSIHGGSISRLSPANWAHSKVGNGVILAHETKPAARPGLCGGPREVTRVPCTLRAVRPGEAHVSC